MDYLERVARHYNEWPKGGVETVALSSEGPWITKDKWLAKRAELQNKPSWDYAPNWARWLAQDGDNGSWYWYEYKPYPESDEFLSNEQMDLATKFGEVLGSFTDTLEQRPGNFFQGQISNLYVNGERRMLPHEWKGPEDGLPPVGSDCEIMTPYQGYEYGNIRLYDGDDVVWRNKNGHLISSKLQDAEFRLPKSAEDKAVEEMLSLFDGEWPTNQCVLLEKACRELYRNGYRKESAE